MRGLESKERERSADVLPNVKLGLNEVRRCDKLYWLLYANLLVDYLRGEMSEDSIRPLKRPADRMERLGTSDA